MRKILLTSVGVTALAVSANATDFTLSGSSLLNIADDGNGFSKDIIDKLGEPYISKNSQGMGLGIFISKNLIENMGGKLSFYNSNGNKAVVEIVFDNSILSI